MALNLDTLGLSATVTSQGISAPDYQTILGTITSYFREIYGSDAYLEPDSKDGQMVAVVALAIHDANNTAIQIYNSFSPATAQAAALSSNVKINGITRKVATNSTVDLELTGEPGATITNGSVKDKNGIIWLLPSVVSIGFDGASTVTATCGSRGAVAALPGTVTTINTPTRGWISATNNTAAVVGRAAETDGELRMRQAQSVALAAVTPFDALDGAIANIAGVTRHKLYENSTGEADSNGLPPHAISAVVDGGNATDIAQTIRNKKTPGVPTEGNTSIDVPDSYGTIHTVKFSRPIDVPIYVSIELKVMAGYTSAVWDEVKKAIASYINSLGIGKDVLLSRLFSPANLTIGTDSENGSYYDVLGIKIGVSESEQSATNIPIAFDSYPSCITNNISLTVTS